MLDIRQRITSGWTGRGAVESRAVVRGGDDWGWVAGFEGNGDDQELAGDWRIGDFKEVWQQVKGWTSGRL